MEVDIVTDWNKIRDHFRRSFRSSFHVSIASIDSEDNPTATPIGSLFLNTDQTGFYFEKYPTKLPRYAKINNKVCILAVNSSRLFWFRSLFLGKFNRYPAIKLYGQLGDRREVRDEEVRRLERRFKATKGLKGNTYLWGDMGFVRDLTFTKAEKINLGAMTLHL